ncbi:membrane-fusion protein [Candidatus Scalindua japonica]|uniref:Membrane-fusion protein n=1 Tax=Candidatus Scalindua japonica TaxID=1284222 RepID=A0A286TUV7_9BACT|nr:efflux RND transporter periplasmic adaptor subunit [Candidatus Scalindua japonica]GAX59669.1 membrane-fusion protein [Candidatus Scalindua japonica]
MNKKIQRVATPAFLRKKLSAFRVEHGKGQIFLVKDKVYGQTHQFEPWQFFVLEVLPGCEDFSKLASVFKDRFGHTITQEELENLLFLVDDKKLFGASEITHPILEAFNKKKETEQWTSSVEENSESRNNTEPELTTKVSEEPFYTTTDDADLEATVRKREWNLFNPTWLLKIFQPFLLPFKHTIYFLPLLLILATVIYIRHAVIVEKELVHLFDGFSIIKNLLFSMFVVNFSVTWVKALVAFTFRATVSGFCIVFYLGFIPRFKARIDKVRQLSRREQIWLHASPLLMRLGLFSFGLLLWFNIRSTDSLLSSSALTAAVVGLISFLITVNPLVKSDGYYLLTALVNEPHLRGKSYRALINKVRGNVYQKTDNNVLAAYGLASILFMVLLYAVILIIMSSFLNIYLGGPSILFIVIAAPILIFRMIEKFRKIGQLYERTVQFERWRSRTLPKVEDDIVRKKNQNSLTTYLKRSIPACFLIILFIPWKYEPGGGFVILPNKKQEITAEINGIIDEIFFDGGEYLKKGTVIGRLSYSDYLAKVKIYNAKMQEQQAVIDELKSRPKPEEIQLAESALEVECSRYKFSSAKVKRLEELYEEHTISFEELDEVRREADVDLKRVEEKRANLELIKSGAAPDQIAAAEAKLLSWQEERDYNQEMIEKSIFYMPFDGKIITMHLKQKIGSYLNMGEPFATVENTDQVIAEIEIPEHNIGYIEKLAKIRGRSNAYYNIDFTGQVVSIDTNVTESQTGNIVKVCTLIDNKDGLLKSGMSGYMKISSEAMPIWKVLSLSVIRFFKIEVWSWHP